MPTSYSPVHINEYTSKALNARVQGVLGTATAGTTTSIDWCCPEDRIMSGGILLAKDSAWGDKVSIQVVDKDNIFGYGAGVVLQEFVNSYYLPSDTQSKAKLEMPYPAKVYAGLYLRIVYTSVGLIDVGVAINYLTHKILI